MVEKLRLAVLQSAPALRQETENVSALRALLERAPADLALTPELSLTGYDLRDAVSQHARTDWSELSFQTPTLLGAVALGDDLIPFNVAVLAGPDGARIVHHKVYLPTYGMFDEGRYFGRGRHVRMFEVNGWRIGVLICEDFWHPALTYLLAMQGIHVLLVMAAAPGRGALAGGEEGAFFASSDSWERIARTAAQLYGIYVAVCNRCGVEGGVTFAGESLVVAPDARVLARAGVEPDRLDVELLQREIARARRPYAHLRDDDVRLVLSELQHITGLDADA